MQMEMSGGESTGSPQDNCHVVRVTIVDPPAYTPPYDHALSAALARRGLDVELVTSRFRFGAVPAAEGYRRTEPFYRAWPSSAAAKALQHPLDMSRLGRRLRHSGPGVVHFQWLPIPAVDRLLLRTFPRPVVLTAHDVLPREVRRGAGAGTRAVLRAVDAVVVHSLAGRSRLVDEVGLDDGRVHVIPHGAFDHLARLPVAAAPGLEGLNGRRIVLFFGLVRPYKGVDLLVEAMPATPPDAVLLVVGMPRTPVAPLQRRATELGIEDRVRFVSRFVPDGELSAYFRRADVVALPYRDIDQSGVLYTALAFGAPLLLSAVGGFPEIAAQGAARLVEPGSVASLRSELVKLLEDGDARRRMSEAALRLARTEHSWDAAAAATEHLYRQLLEERP
jgi:glycosyltransferase involved in cell wall biosynthesis